MSPAVVYQVNVSKGGVPKQPIPEGRVTKLGIEGDGHAKPQIHGGPTRALSLFPLEAIEALASEGHPIEPGSAGENLTIRGLPWSDLAPGARLRLGSEVRIRIESHAAPCRTIAGSFADGDVSRLNQRAHPGRSRLYASVQTEGVVRPGDEVTIEARAEARPADPSRRTSMIAPSLSYVNLYVSDLARSVEFFEKTLGLELQFSDPSFGYASFAAGPVRMGLAQVDGGDESNRGLVGRQTGFGFAVPDLVAAHEELSARGVSFTMKPEKQPWGGFMGLFEDPDGNVFYLDEIAAG